MAESESNILINALIGAVVTVIFSFTIVSPVVGGAVAGYLHSTDGARVGTLAGGIAVIPLFLLASLGIFLYAIASIPVAIGILIIVFILIFGVIWTVGLSALGGYLGVYLRAELK